MSRVGVQNKMITSAGLGGPQGRFVHIHAYATKSLQNLICDKPVTTPKV
jgi:hypothetical protein